MLVLVLVIYALLAVYEYIPLYKQKLWRDFWTNTVLGFFSFVIAVLLSLGIKIPSPETPIRYAITLIFGK